MKRHKLIIFIATLPAYTLPLSAVEYIDWVEWDKIEHWAGDPEGTKKCALVVDFQDGKSNKACVWGYRWNGSASGEDLVRAVASQSSVLTAMIQYTGTMGSTLNALGISRDREELNYLQYDFEGASVAGEISFGFFDPNSAMGQETAPGFDAANMCGDAIERARTTGIIEHPLNACVYGYAAYDYDYWQLADDYADINEYRWKAGWYEGYWSYWHGPNDYDYMGYSGLGMSSTVLVDGGVQAWKYTPLNGGEGFGITGGEMAYELDYEMSDWNEEMHPAEAPEILIPHDNVCFWVGEGEKAATVVLQFNDGKGPENLVYGYRWSGGWDNTLSDVLTAIVEADPALSIMDASGNPKLTFDSGRDGKIDDIDHNSDHAGEWKYFVRRTVDPNFNNVSSTRWLNPGAVMIVAKSDKDLKDVELPYLLMRPEIGSERILTIPDNIDYTLSDDNLVIPFFIELPEGSRINTAFTWSRPEMLSRINTHAFAGTISSYKDFKPGEAEVSVRGSYVPAGSTEAIGVESNLCKINFHAPVRPVEDATFENQEIRTDGKGTIENRLNIYPQDATFTRFTFRSSNPEVASVNSASGEVTLTGKEGKAVIYASYVADPEISASFEIVNGDYAGIDQPVCDEEFVLSGDTLSIRGAKGSTICVYDITGVPVCTFLVESVDCSIPFNYRSGVYIITKDGKAVSKINRL
ncbi:MAG: Ig-like domain-containing protein [Muribaculaceae bacterium]|nr:Ig-like domain-containing protein [Muribaculaceae bacterium]